MEVSIRTGVYSIIKKREKNQSPDKLEPHSPPITGIGPENKPKWILPIDCEPLI